MTSALTPLQRVLGGGLLIALLALIGGLALPARAQHEADITFTVRQDPPQGAQLKPNGRITFEIDITSTAVALNDPRYFDLKLPEHMAFETWATKDENIVSTCERDVPEPGVVRCTTKANAVISDDVEKPEIVLHLKPGAGAAGRTYSDEDIQGLFKHEDTGFRSSVDDPEPDNVDPENEDEEDELHESVGGFTVEFLKPTLAALSPASVVEGSGPLTLAVTGTGFVNGKSVVHWNGTALFTEFVSETELHATVPASLLAEAGTAEVTVHNPEPGGGPSGPRTFNITQKPPPAPTLSVTSVTPNSALTTAGNTTITIAGDGFVADTKVRWQGTDLATTVSSTKELKATVPANLLSDVGEFSLMVVTPGGDEAGPLTFTVNYPKPTITALKPDKSEAGSDGFSLEITGTGFVTATNVSWGETELDVVSRTATKIVAEVPAELLKDEGTFAVKVETPGPYGGGAATRDFKVDPPKLTTTDKLAHVPVEGFVPRSRLAFVASTSDLAPDSVSVVVKRTKDGQYWNGDKKIWQKDPFKNPAVKDAGANTWRYAVTGEARRQFVSTEVEVEVHAKKGTRDYVGEEKQTIAVR